MSAPIPSDALQLPLHLHRSQGRDTRGAVLLLHGASASSETFLEPQGHSLVEYLTQERFDVWLLDWRGSHRVIDQLLDPSHRDKFTMDAVAEHDIPLAIERIHAARAKEGKAGLPLHVVAHCFGAGCLAMSVAAGKLEQLEVTNIVLLTLGLFYVAPWDGFIKAEDFVLERVLGTAPQVTAIRPGTKPPRKRPDHGWAEERRRRRTRDAESMRLGVARSSLPPTRSDTPEIWPSELEEAYETWPKQLLPSCDSELCHRVSFMFGQPYLEQNLADGIHTPGKLSMLFGSMPIALYVHAGQNVRRGYAAPFDAPLDVKSKHELKAYLRHAPFDRHHVTLITGTENTIWHCDSIHRMHDWLMSSGRRRVTKHVLPDYGHQDLLWGKSSKRDVFPKILAGLETRSI